MVLGIEMGGSLWMKIRWGAGKKNIMNGYIYSREGTKKKVDLIYY